MNPPPSDSKPSMRTAIEAVLGTLLALASAGIALGAVSISRDGDYALAAYSMASGIWVFLIGTTLVRMAANRRVNEMRLMEIQATSAALKNAIGGLKDMNEMQQARERITRDVVVDVPGDVPQWEFEGELHCRGCMEHGKRESLAVRVSSTRGAIVSCATCNDRIAHLKVAPPQAAE